MLRSARVLSAGLVARRAVRSVSFKSPFSVPLPEVPVSDYISENFEKYGEKPALVDGPTGRSITFKDLPFRIGTAAKGFAAKGMKDGDVLDIHMPNLPEYVVAFQAAASLGAVLTTSSPLYTASELAYQFRDSGAKFCLTIPQFLPTVKEAAAQADIKEIFVLGEPSAGFLFQNDGKSRVQSVKMDPKEHVLVMPYSSGTTGLPKGVILTHHNMTSNVQQIIAHPELSADLKSTDTCLGLLPMFHIYGMTFCTMATLKSGATLVTMPKFEPQPFLETLVKHKVTYAPLVPPIINFLARHPIVDKYDLSSLRMIFSGAAPLDAVSQHVVEQRLKGVSCRQGYGMTELSPVSHIAHPKHVIPGSIGQTVPNAESMIRDVDTGAGLPAGPNNVGELCVRGPNVMKGYINNPTATADTIDKDGWLHTGDIGWRDEEGNYYIVDRLKELIKCKGYQVAPAELEGLLLQCPGLADAAVVAKKDDRSGEVPVAFVVRKQGDSSPTEDEVKAFISSKVAEYKQLAQVQFIAAIPKSASGKILRKDLKKLLEAK